MTQKFTETHRLDAVRQVLALHHEVEHLRDRIVELHTLLTGSKLEPSQEEIDKTVNRILSERNYWLVLRPLSERNDAQMGVLLVEGAELSDGYEFIPYPVVQDDPYTLGLIECLLKYKRIDKTKSTFQNALSSNRYAVYMVEKEQSIDLEQTAALAAAEALGADVQLDSVIGKLQEGIETIRRAHVKQDEANDVLNQKLEEYRLAEQSPLDDSKPAVEAEVDSPTPSLDEDFSLKA